MTAIVFSTKGQLVIPKVLRDAKGFGPGVAVEAVDHPEGVLLKAMPSRKIRPIAELSGMLAKYYEGPPISVEDMHEGLAQWFETDPQWTTPKA